MLFGDILIYSDLDGTLLDEEYSFTDALPALNEVKRRGLPLIICSSKTRAEIGFYRKKLGLGGPFISENGGAIFIPEGYFPELDCDRVVDGYCVIEFGSRYQVIRDAFREIQEGTDCVIRGFGDLCVGEVMELSGLDSESARLSRMREYDEPFVIECGACGREGVFGLIEGMGFRHTRGGLFYHMMGDSDKGRAVRVLTDIYRRNGFHGEVVALGDSCNDLPMLRNVDTPVLIRRPDGGFPVFQAENLIKSGAVGPRGWSEVILKIIGD